MDPWTHGPIVLIWVVSGSYTPYAPYTPDIRGLCSRSAASASAVSGSLRRHGAAHHISFGAAQPRRAGRAVVTFCCSSLQKLREKLREQLREQLRGQLHLKFREKLREKLR